MEVPQLAILRRQLDADARDQERVTRYLHLTGRPIAATAAYERLTEITTTAATVEDAYQEAINR